MSFRCGICSNTFSANGTEHALCSTKCRHLVGKSCLEKWIDENNVEGEFNCPVCRQSVCDYFPIYDVPNELFQIALNGAEDKCQSEDDVTRRCALGTLKEKHLFIRQGVTEPTDMYKSNIEFFDAFNGYILIVGNCLFDYDLFFNCNNDFVERIYFLKIYKSDRFHYNKEFKAVRITAVALNKCFEDSFEFCVGFENGSLKNVVLTLANGIRDATLERKLFNEDEKIHSICFLDKSKVIYSVGGCNIFIVPTNNLCVKKIWLGNANVELKAVTNLKAINGCVLLRIMDGKIYLFDINKILYISYSEKSGTQVSNYAFDPVASMVLVVHSSPYDLVDSWEPLTDEN